jgi:hypothetical protein
MAAAARDLPWRDISRQGPPPMVVTLGRGHLPRRDGSMQGPPPSASAPGRGGMDPTSGDADPLSRALPSPVDLASGATVRGWARWACPQVFFFLFPIWFTEAGKATVSVKPPLTVVMPISINVCVVVTCTHCSSKRSFSPLKHRVNATRWYVVSI